MLSQRRAVKEGRGAKRLRVKKEEEASASHTGAETQTSLRFMPRLINHGGFGWHLRAASAPNVHLAHGDEDFRHHPLSARRISPGWGPAAAVSPPRPQTQDRDPAGPLAARDCKDARRRLALGRSLLLRSQLPQHS